MSGNQGCQCGGELIGACETEYEYAVKLVCGSITVLPTAQATPLAPGRYYTAVNIHYPGPCGQANIRWKVSIANEGAPGFVSPFHPFEPLAADSSIEIDCSLIMKALPAPPPQFAKGYVVIVSDRKLDVVAVYSAAQSISGPVTAFHTERVAERCMPVCQDLILPLNTGVMAWQKVFPSLAPVALVNPAAGGWIAPPFGASWVSANATDGGAGPTGANIYFLKFDLCFGFTVPPQFQLQAVADGGADVYLNTIAPANKLGTVNSWTSYVSIPFNTSLLRAGTNYLIAIVTNGGNTPNPTGFALAGTLIVPRGKCPCSDTPLAGRQVLVAATVAEEIQVPKDLGSQFTA